VAARIDLQPMLGVWSECRSDAFSREPCACARDRDIIEDSPSGLQPITHGPGTMPRGASELTRESDHVTNSSAKD
jgi:hypothetical protein